MDAAFIWKLSKLGGIGSSRQKFDDDFADRLNYQYTGVLLFLFIGIIGIRQYVGKPIQCWIPQEFTRGWEEYTENYCWVANTYFAAVSRRLPLVPDRQASLLVYYQWAPIVLATQALLLYLPCLIWRIGMRYSGFSVHRVLRLAAMESNEIMPEASLKTVHVMARYLETCMQRQKLHRSSGYSSTNNTTNNNNNNSSNSKHSNNGGTSAEVPITKYSELQTGELPQSPNAPTSYQSQVPKTKLLDSAPSTLPTSASSRKPPPPPPPPLSSKSGISVDPGQLETGVCEHLINQSSSCQVQILDEHPKPFKRTNKTTKQKKLCSGKRCGSTAALCKALLGDCFRAQGHAPSSAFPPSLSPNALSCSGRRDNFLTALYIFVKCLYVTNAVGQIYLMERFVGAKVSFYGFRVLADLVEGRDWQQSGNFPRVTFCDMEAKKLGENHIYSIQCVLPINMFLEKIYIFLWFWHIMLSVVTLSSLIGWIRRVFWHRMRLKFIRHYLKVTSVLPPNLDSRDRQRTRQFVDEYLTADVFFLIRLIGSNSGDLLASELTRELWMGFLYRHHGGLQASSLLPTRPTPCNCEACLHRPPPPTGPTGFKSEARMFGEKYYPGRNHSQRKLSHQLIHYLHWNCPSEASSIREQQQQQQQHAATTSRLPAIPPSQTAPVNGGEDIV